MISRSAPETDRFDPNSCYLRLREPKRRGGVQYPPGSEDRIVQDLQYQGFTVRNYCIDLHAYREYFRAARYETDFPQYYPTNRAEKSLEHYVAAMLLELSARDAYIDIASEHSPVPAIYNSLFGARTYRQDLAYPPGLIGDTIGGDAAAMPVRDGFATKMALHCSLEHFEGDSDIRFFREANRVLAPGGVVCVVPLYLCEHYAVQTDPVIAVAQNVGFEDDAVLYCADNWGNRHGRFYDAEHLASRLRNATAGIQVVIYRLVNVSDVDPSCYARFAMLMRKSTGAPGAH
jgi:SAM-dependent methyltransferase